MSHYLVIVLRCGTIPIIYTTLLSCSHSCQLFKLRHIIAVASIHEYHCWKQWQTVFLLHCLRKKMKNLQTQTWKKQKRDTGRSLWGVLQSYLLIHFSDCNPPQAITPRAGRNWSRWTCLDWSPTPTKECVKVILNQKHSSGCSLTELINQYLGDLFACNLCWALLGRQPLHTCLLFFQLLIMHGSK